MTTNLLPAPVLPATCDRRMWRTIRFAGQRDPKLKAWLPDNSKLHGGPGCAAGMVRMAIRDRVDADRCTQKAKQLLETGDQRQERAAKRELIYAGIARERMRSSALWARVFAEHLANDDARLELLARRQSDRIRRIWRAQVWADRWQRVQAVRTGPSGTKAVRARCTRLLHRIAARHNALNPLGYTLQDNTEG